MSDLTAFVIVAAIDGVMHVRPTFWLPGDGLRERSRADRVPYDLWAGDGKLTALDGPAIDYERVAQLIADAVREHDIQTVAFDRWNMRHLKPWLAKAGLSEADIDARFEDFGQGFASMSPALRTLETALLFGRVRHRDHPVLKMCAANAVMQRDPAGNRKLYKARSRGRIGGMVALAMAASVAEGALEQAGPSYVAEHDLVVV